jgi:mannitol/fructose-specific phosphotransferase system IIA component (Ntr-type)
VRLEALTRPELIFPALHAADADGALRAVADEIAAAGLVADADELFQRLVERERLGSTAVGGGVAIPHCKLRGLRQAVVAIGRAEPGIEFGAPDGRPVRVFFVVVSPIDAPAEHLQVLSAVSRWIKDGARLERLLESADRERMWELLGGAG